MAVDDDFEMTIRPDAMFTRSAPRAELAQVVARQPGVVEDGAAFRFRPSFDQSMHIHIETRRWDGKIGERIEPGNTANCIHLCIPAAARGRETDRACFELAFAIADYLGWTLFDDTDSGSMLSKEWMEMAYPTKKASQSWWRRGR